MPAFVGMSEHDVDVPIGKYRRKPLRQARQLERSFLIGDTQLDTRLSGNPDHRHRRLELASAQHRVSGPVQMAARRATRDVDQSYVGEARELAADGDRL